MTYTASFTAGSLLLEETLRVVRAARDESGSEPLLDAQFVRTEASRRRRSLEIRNRVSQLSPALLEYLRDTTPRDAAIILFYACLKTYALLFDLQMSLLLPRWRSLEIELTRDDILRFLDVQSEKHPEISSWTELTRKKVAQVYLRMLKEVGIWANNQVSVVDAPENLWSLFLREGDAWFLEAMLLNKQRRDAVASSL